jgi:RNA polymerase sigma-70 factor (ECF subfamily)
MTGPEIAARTGMTHGSVRVNLHRGMEQLRAKLSPTRMRPEQEKS